MASSRVGTAFSMLAMAMWVLGRVSVRSALPSLVTRAIEPVSAINRLAPVSPTSAARNSRRSMVRASSKSSRGWSRGRSAANSRCLSLKVSATWSMDRWMAGAIRWLGGSLRNWMMYSPRSVSTGRTPLASRWPLMAISSPIMDLLLVTVSAPASWQMAKIISRASAASLAQCTWPPCSITFDSNCCR